MAYSPTAIRNMTAVGTGVVTGLAGTTIALIGLAVGALVQVLEPTNPQLQKVSNITEGVVDGSAALVGQALFSGRR